MATTSDSTAIQEMKAVRRALLDLTQALLHVATATITTAAGATFALIDEALERVRKPTRKPTDQKPARARMRPHR